MRAAGWPSHRSDGFGHGPKTTIYFKALILFMETLKSLSSLPNDFYVLVNSHPASVCDL